MVGDFFKRSIKVIAQLMRSREVLSLAIILLFGVILILVGTHSSNPVIKTSLLTVGATMTASSTVSVLVQSYYDSRRRHRFREELGWFIEQIWKVLKNPVTTLNLSALQEARAETFYKDRKGRAIEDVRHELGVLLETKEDTEVYLIGDTLRVFFHSGAPFSELVRRIVESNSRVALKVLILNPSSPAAFYKSLAETDPPFNNYDDYVCNSSLYLESKMTRQCIESFNQSAMRLSEVNITPIEVRCYDCADMCVAAIFPSACYTAQYLYGDPPSQTTTINMPMIKYSKASTAYTRIKYHFDFIWNHAILYNEEALNNVWKLDIAEHGHLQGAKKKSAKGD